MSLGQFARLQLEEIQVSERIPRLALFADLFREIGPSELDHGLKALMSLVPCFNNLRIASIHLALQLALPRGFAAYRDQVFGDSSTV